MDISLEGQFNAKRSINCGSSVLQVRWFPMHTVHKQASFPDALVQAVFAHQLGKLIRQKLPSKFRGAFAAEMPVPQRAGGTAAPNTLQGNRPARVEAPLLRPLPSDDG